MPEGSIATPNILGYGPIDDLNPEGRNAITGLYFPPDDADSMEGRIQFSRELMTRVNHTLESMGERYKIAPAGQKKKVVPNLVGYLEVSQPSPSFVLSSFVRSVVRPRLI